MKYHDNLESRYAIDELLHQNAIIQSNLGTEHAKNSPERKEAKAKWREILKKIKAIDPDFGRLIALQD